MLKKVLKGQYKIYLKKGNREKSHRGFFNWFHSGPSTIFVKVFWSRAQLSARSWTRPRSLSDSANTSRTSTVREAIV